MNSGPVAQLSPTARSLRCAIDTQNASAVCTLHKGITSGLLDRLDPGARLANFVANDPYDAGCLIELSGTGS